MTADIQKYESGLSMEKHNELAGRFNPLAEGVTALIKTAEGISVDGETLCLKDWSVRYGITLSALRNRLNRGWAVTDALNISVRPKRKNGHKND